MLSTVTSPQDLDEHFRTALGDLTPPDRPRDPDGPVRDGGRLTGAQANSLFDAQLASRHLDLAARWLRSFGEGYYTIGSAGHEGNAAVAAALRPTDPALLHYRSGAFCCARSAQVGNTDPIRDVLRGLVASAEEPIAGGRHKVFGHPDLQIIPTTSTIASHLPRAVGLGFAVERGRRLGADAVWPSDAVAVCSFGDGSINHASAVAAFNTAGWCDHAGLRIPVLFVCEDNGIGLSVRSPEGWVTAALQAKPGLRYSAADGCDLAATYDATAEAVAWKVRKVAEEVLAEPKLADAAEVVAPLAPRRPVRVARTVADAGTTAVSSARITAFGGRLPEDGPRLTLAQAINATLTDAMVTWPQAFVCGQDVALKGGVYGVTKGLRERFGAGRVFDTLLDETSVLGFGLGAGLGGMLPIPEIQYLAYLHSAEDQLRGEAATMSFFSRGSYRNPMVVRIAGLAYQEGFGGHFHNDNAVGVLRDIPGLVVACPARPDDAAALLRTCLAAAVVDGTVSVFLEPIALYHT